MLAVKHTAHSTTNGSISTEADLRMQIAALKAEHEKLRDEAVQTAAVALAIVECLDRAKWSWPQNVEVREPRHE